MSTPLATHQAARQRQLLAWALLCVLLIYAAMAGPFFLGLVYSSDDLGAFHLPLRWFYAQCLQRGEAFDWMPQLYAGFYLTGEGQVGAYHPLHLALYRWLPFQAAFDLELLLSYPCLLAGTFVFLNRRIHDRAAALFGAMVFAYSGFNLLHFVHPNAIAVAAHLPWILWTLDIAWRDASGRRRVLAEALLAGLIASQCLLGYPQYVWFTIVAATVYLVFLTRESNSTWRWRGRFAMRVAFAGLLGLATAAIQLLPTLEALHESQRQVVEPGFASSGSLHPLNLIQAIAPYLFRTRVVGVNTHELGLYCGAVPFLLAVWLLLERAVPLGSLTGPGTIAGTGGERFDSPRRLAQFGIALGGLALVLAMGEYAGLYQVQTWLPLVGKFRMPARYLVLVHFALATFSAVAFSRLCSSVDAEKGDPDKGTGTRHPAAGTPYPGPVREPGQPGNATISRSPIWRFVLASIGLALVGPWLWGTKYVADWQLVWLGPLLLGLAAAGIEWARRGGRWAPVALMLLTAIDLAAYGLSYAIYPNAVTMAAVMAAGPALPKASLAEVGGPRIATDLTSPDQPGLRTGNHLSMRGFRQIDGYAGLEPRRRLNYRLLAALRVAGVGYLLPGAANVLIEGTNICDEDWLQVPWPLDRARFVTKVRRSENPAVEIAQIPIESEALVECDLQLSGGRPGVARIVSDRPGQIVVKVSAANDALPHHPKSTIDDQLLIVNERYHAGWQCQIDGKRAEVLRVNGEFLGCVVEPGRHRQVCWEFRPISLKYGKLVSCCGLTTILVVVSLRLCWSTRGDRCVLADSCDQRIR